MSGITIVLGLLFALIMGARAVSDKPLKVGPKLSASDLVGGYTIVAGEKFGVKEPEERILGSTVQFSEDRIVVSDKDKHEVYGATYELEPGEGEGPRRITMTSKLASDEGEVAKGLIEKHGDEIRLIYALPGGQEPTEFKTKEKQLLFVMKSRDK
jgi:uncharacterized protein (TIGR03067 family)